MLKHLFRSPFQGEYLYSLSLSSLFSISSPPPPIPPSSLPLSTYLSFSLSAYLSVLPSVCPPISVCLSVCLLLSLYLSPFAPFRLPNLTLLHFTSLNLYRRFPFVFVSSHFLSKVAMNETKEKGREKKEEQTVC